MKKDKNGDLSTWELTKERVSLFFELVISPLKGHAAVWLFFLGVVFIVLGSFFGDYLDNAIGANAGRTSLNIGSATLGAGIFALIMQTTTFVNVLKKHLYSVIYSPETERPYHSLVDSWTTLTEAILRNVLPIVHANAAETIKNKFFDEEIDFHFEQYCVEYEINVEEDGSVRVIEKLTANIYLSPHRENPIFEQTSEVIGVSKILSLRLNGKSVDNNVQSKDEIEGIQKNKLSIPLNEYIQKEIKNELSQRVIKYERVEEFNQPRLNDEPYIIGDLSRYTKGYEVRAKITEGYNLFFETLGMSKTVEDPKEVELHSGWKSWTIADNHVTLLPGSGFIIVISKQTKAEKNNDN